MADWSVVHSDDSLMKGLMIINGERQLRFYYKPLICSVQPTQVQFSVPVKWRIHSVADDMACTSNVWYNRAFSLQVRHWLRTSRSFLVSARMNSGTQNFTVCCTILGTWLRMWVSRVGVYARLWIVVQKPRVFRIPNKEVRDSYAYWIRRLVYHRIKGLRDTLMLLEEIT